MQFIKLNKPAYILSGAAIGGSKEKEGPLGDYFDITDKDAKFGTKTFEAAESEIQRLALNTALKKAQTHHGELEAILAGDLLNQCVGSAYGLLEFDTPFIGLYGACSTMAESLALGSVLLDGGHYNKLACVTSSHFCAAERQFRYPLEYGGQRAPTSQWTATAAGAVILGANNSNANSPKIPKITEVMFGRIIDKGITDINNMGAAMAPAAADVLFRYFKESCEQPESFDLIATGDLGAEGLRICKSLLLAEGLDLGDKYDDCGLMLYDCEKQDVHAGGSGCGCSAGTFCGYILNKLNLGEYKNVLLVGTGALMSPGSVMQGNTIPGVAHLIRVQI